MNPNIPLSPINNTRIEGGGRRQRYKNSPEIGGGNMNRGRGGRHKIGPKQVQSRPKAGSTDGQNWPI